MSRTVAAMRAPGSDSSARDDRVLPEVRLVAPLIIAILILAVLVLYLNPDKTDRYFAWTIKPSLTALVMGAGYLMGIYFFARVLLAAEWHTVAVGFIPITAFTIAMLLATLLHLDRFHQGTLAFWMWLVIYVITPFLVPFLWFRNRPRDLGRSAREPQVPRIVRWGMTTMGVVFMLVVVIAFIFPSLLIGLFPWTLTPLTARVVAGWMLFPAVGGLALGAEPRWTGWRVVIEAFLVGIVFVLLALPRAWNDLNLSNPLAWAYLAGLALSVIVVPLFYLWMERNARALVAVQEAA